ncbi:MAG TPA: GTPase HflX [Gemmatimonadaceae bacterium]|jgi:GTP-binding protein HflX|nr:GTPase HflX [Gemmatimonadaceae bacterium]
MAKEIIVLSAPVERAILVGAPLKRSNARHLVNEHLRELERLADTAGAVVVGELTQNLDRPNPSTYVGKGKLDELKIMAAEREATVMIFDDELTPAQGKNLELELGTRVIDRAELILDIFAVRARSAESRMQVELAQLEYSLPRLTRMWTHLEKFRGGIGVRGPGETQLETDRRLIGLRIKVLKDRLMDVQRSREVQRQSRKNVFRASLVGYTNAGKSSVLRAMSGESDIFVEDRLFATLDPLTRDISVGENQKVLLTDTVGFIRKLPHHLVASFRATLEEVGEADLLLHVIDASHPTWEEQRMVVDEVLADLKVNDTPVVHVFNKTDALPPEELSALRERMANLLPGSLFVSAITKGGMEPLRESLLASVRNQRPLVKLRLPAARGKLIAEIHRDGEVVSAANDEQTGDVVMSARVDSALLGRLEREGVVQGG